MGKRRIKTQDTRVIRVDQDASLGESNSPYWEHVRDEGEDRESPLANPDLLTDEAENKLYPGSVHSQLEEDVLAMLRNKDLGHILTKEEHKILRLIVDKGLSIRKIVSATGLPIRTVFRRLASARQKLRKYLELDD